MKTLVTVVCCMFFAIMQGQQVRRDEMSAMTIRGNIGIQKPISSSRFHQSFAGLYEGNVSFNLKVAGNLTAGLGYQSTNFKNNKFLKYKYFNAELPYNTSLICDAGFVRLGYDHFFKTNAFASYALNTGFMLCKYTNVNPDSSALNRPFIGKRFNAPYLQPEFSLNFVMEQRLAFSLFLSYTTVFQKFDARAPRLNHFNEVQIKRNDYVISYFNFGFGFTVLLGK